MLIPSSQDYQRNWIIDASPLFKCVLASLFVSNPSLETQGEFKDVLRDQFAFEGKLNYDMIRFYERILTQLKSVYISSHVIGEMVGLSSSKLASIYRPLFWKTLCSLVIQFNLDERMVKLLDAHNNAKLGVYLPQYGVSDISAIELTINLDGIFLTNDHKSQNIFLQRCFFNMLSRIFGSLKSSINFCLFIIRVAFLLFDSRE
jgi:hypothetical protein